MNQKKFWTYENRILGLLSLTFGIVMFDRVALNMLLPFIAPELGLSNTQIGMLASGLGLAMAFSGYVIGGIADRQGARKKWLIVVTVLFSLFSISSGLAVSFATMLLTRVLLGLAEGPVLPLAQSIMAMESSEHRRGFNMGVLQNFSSSLFGTLLAPIVLVWLATEYGWRTAFYIAGIPGILLAVLCALQLREPKAAPHSQAAAAQHHEKLSPMQMLKNRNLLLCMIISSAMIAWLIVQMIFLPIYLTKVRGMAPTEMAQLLSLTGVAALFAAVFVSRLSDSIGRKPTLIIFSLLGIIGPLSAVYLEPSIAMLALPMSLSYLACGCLPQCVAIVPAETIAPKYLAATVGFLLAVSEVLGGFLMPTVAGISADQLTPAAPMLLASGAAALSALTALLLRETAPLKVLKLKRMEAAS